VRRFWIAGEAWIPTYPQDLYTIYFEEEKRGKIYYNERS
jgi:hypothetical protein